MTDANYNSLKKNKKITKGKTAPLINEKNQALDSKNNINSVELTDEAKLKLSNLAEEAKNIWSGLKKTKNNQTNKITFNNPFNYCQTYLNKISLIQIDKIWVSKTI